MLRLSSHALSADSTYRLHTFGVAPWLMQHGTWKPSMVSQAAVAVLLSANAC